VRELKVENETNLNANDLMFNNLRVVIAGRSFEDEKKAKMGIVECVKHSLIEPFNVLYEREGICLSCYLLKLD